MKADSAVDPRIQSRIVTYLTNWFQYGQAMGPLNYFVAGATPLIDQYGIYGLLYDMRIQESFKSAGVDAVRLAPRPATPTSGAIREVPFTANCSADSVGGARPLQPPYYCAYFGSNTTFDFFLQTPPAGGGGALLEVIVFVGSPWENATIGVQLGAGVEQVVACPGAGGWVAWLPCNAARFPLAAGSGGVNIVRLRSIGPFPLFRTYNIATIDFSVSTDATRIAAAAPERLELKGALLEG